MALNLARISGDVGLADAARKHPLKTIRRHAERLRLRAIGAGSPVFADDEPLVRLSRKPRTAAKTGIRRVVERQSAKNGGLCHTTNRDPLSGGSIHHARLDRRAEISGMRVPFAASGFRAPWPFAGIPGAAEQIADVPPRHLAAHRS